MMNGISEEVTEHREQRLREVTSWKEAEALAKAVLEGKPTAEYPNPFSYTQAAWKLAEFILRERQLDRSIP